MSERKEALLAEPVQHIDIKTIDCTDLVEAMARMSFQARSLGRAAMIYDRMLADGDCTVILTLAGSLCSSGLKRVIHDLVEADMVDIIVSSGANMVDMDFFEAIGFKHYMGSVHADDEVLHDLSIDRIYDTYIDEDELRACDAAVGAIADGMEPGVYSSREFIEEMGRWLDAGNCRVEDSIIRAAYRKGVPIFVPAFSDCSAGFGLMDHQRRRPDAHVSIDSVKDFRELCDLCLAAERTGIVILSGGVPQNFVQDAVLGVNLTEDGELSEEPRMHSYAIKVTVTDEHDGSLSGSTFREAHSWGKVEVSTEQVVYAEATIAVPIIASYAYHRHKVRGRPHRRLNDELDSDR